MYDFIGDTVQLRASPSPHMSSFEETELLVLSCDFQVASCGLFHFL